MPQHEEHCLHSEKRYGVRGDEIHTWIDEPSQISGGSHRNYRHDLNSLPTAIQIFGKIYGAEMVENIFLDHLKADSEENRKREQQLQDNSLDNPNLWTQEDDNFLWLNFMKKSDEELESELKVKSKSAILKRRKYLGLIRPKVINRTRHNLKVQRLVFKLERCQKFFLTIEINGGKNDIDFGMTGSKNKTIIRDGYGYRGLERVFDGKTLEFVPEVSDNYSFYFSNAFSVITKKDVLVSYHLENGKEVKLHFGL
jgi:hypothetical protein